MELSTIKMPKAEAREAFLNYRRAVRERHTAEDAELMRAYRELSKGVQLIKLTEVIRLGGTMTLKVRSHHRNEPHEVVLPRLAVARAHRSACWTRGIDNQGRVELLGKREIGHSNRRDRHIIGGFEPAVADRSWSAPRIVAQAPTIPPPFRPASKLENYHLLWEAEWSVTPIPPTDPALLKHIGGDLYAVVAVWDLTEIERAVLVGRPVE